MSWQECTLGDVLTLQRGFDITKAQQSDGPFPVVSSSGVNSYHADYKCEGPGVVIGRKGTLGTAFFLEGAYWPHDTSLWVKDFKGNDPRFCYYLLKSLGLEKYDVGSSNPTLNRNHLHLLDTRAPAPQTQSAIADILTAYDDLIENNTRRIAILEDMARRLFEEWSAGNVGGSRVPFSDLADFINGFAFKPAHLGDIGYPVVKIPELQNGVTGKTPFNDGAIVPPRNHINTGDLLFSWSGTFAVKFWIGGPALLNQHLFKVVPNEPHLAAFLLIALRAAMPEFLSESVGATMKHIRRGSLSSVTCASPHGPGGPELCASLGELYSLVNSLRQTNTNLSTTRDLLLPKLISGEIEVRASEEELEAAAA